MLRKLPITAVPVRTAHGPANILSEPRSRPGRKDAQPFRKNNGSKGERMKNHWST